MKMWWFLGNVMSSVGDVFAYLETWWLLWRCCGSFGDVVAI